MAVRQTEVKQVCGKVAPFTTCTR